MTGFKKLGAPRVVVLTLPRLLRRVRYFGVLYTLAFQLNTSALFEVLESKMTNPNLAPGLPEFSLKNKVVLVSGAARGLGLTQAEALLEAGAIGAYHLDSCRRGVLIG